MRIQQFLFLTGSLLGNITLLGSLHKTAVDGFSDTDARQEELRRGKNIRYEQSCERRHQKEAREKQQKIKQKLYAYSSRFLLGFIHGIANNYLSKGSPNQHFFRAPLHEWLTGVGFLTLGAPLCPSVSGELNCPTEVFLSCASIGGGQALGEIIPLNGHWRNSAINWILVSIPVIMAKVWIERHCNARGQGVVPRLD